MVRFKKLKLALASIFIFGSVNTECNWKNWIAGVGAASVLSYCIYKVVFKEAAVYKFPGMRADKICDGGVSISALEDCLPLSDKEYQKYKRILDTDPKWFIKNCACFDGQPLSCLCECISKTCPLSRMAGPLRKNMEDAFLKEFCEKYPDKEQPVVYTSFGSGDAFFDFKFVASLVDKGYKNIVLNLIDIIYKYTLDQIEDTQLASGIDFKSYWGRGIRDRDANSMRFIFNLVGWANIQRWFKDRGDVKLNVFSSADAYKGYMDRIGLSTNIAVAIDMEYSDYFNNGNGAEKDFIKVASTLNIDKKSLAVAFVRGTSASGNGFVQQVNYNK